MNILELTWSDVGGFTRAHVIDPKTTSVKAVAAAGEGVLEAHAAFQVISRERSAAQGDPERLAAEASAAARDAGREGKSIDAKKLRKKVREAEERLGELDLDWEAASENLRARAQAYLETVTHHAPALSAEAMTIADAAIMALASATEIARKSQANMTGSLSILAALAATVEVGAFIPTTPVAKKDTSDEFLANGAPAPYIEIARENLGFAIGFASRIMDDLKARVSAEEKRRKLEAEVEAAPDLGEEDDDGDDDE